jgi:hypothetical protein
MERLVFCLLQVRTLLHHGQPLNLIVLFSHYDSYPSGLGLDLLNTIPKHGKIFQKWLAEMRQHLDETIEAMDNCELDENKVTITREVPCTDLFIEWIYTIDLDRLVFHVDSRPLLGTENNATFPMCHSTVKLTENKYCFCADYRMMLLIMFFISACFSGCARGSVIIAVAYCDNCRSPCIIVASHPANL